MVKVAKARLLCASGAGALLSSIMVTGAAYAQVANPAAPARETAPKPSVDGPVASTTQTVVDPVSPPAAEDEIIVTGIRQSLDAGLQIKRDSIAIVDSIVAEDIGRFPSQNISEALQRIPGVNLDRDGGSNGGSDEGQRIQLRGLGSEFTLTTFNGAPVRTTSSGNVGSATRDFNYDVFSSELFGRADVYKSPLSELEEGGVAGVVNLRTRRPFDGKGGQKIAYAIQANYNDRSNKTRPRGSLIYSNTFGNFGILLGIAGSQTVQVRSGAESSGFYYNENVGARYAASTTAFDDIRRARGQVNALGAPIPLPAPGGLAGADNFRLDYNYPGANLNGLTVEQLRDALVPRILRGSETINERDRIGATGSLQYKDDRFEASFDLLYAKLDDKFQRTNLGFPPRGAVRIGVNGQPNFNVAANGTISNSSIPAWVPLRPEIDADGKLQGRFGNVTLSEADNYRVSSTEFLNTQVNAAWKLTDRLTIFGQASRTESKAQSTVLSTVVDGLDALHTIEFDTRDARQPELTTDRNLLDPTNYRQFTVTGTDTKERDEQKNVRLIVDWQWDLGPVTGRIRTGGSYVNSVKEVIPRQFTNAATDPFNPLNKIVLPNGLSYAAATQAQRAPYIQSLLTPYRATGLSGFPSEWLQVSRGTLERLGGFDLARAAPIASVQFFEATEAVTAGFFQSDFEFDLFGNPLRGNAGVRYVKTDVSIENFLIAGATSTRRTTETSYDNWLPSLTLAYNLTDNVVLRAAYSKTLTRVGLTNIARPVRIPSPFNTFIERGNPDLQPQISENIDLIGEWYLPGGGQLSLGYFDKQLTNRVLTRQQTLPFGELGLDPGLFSIQGGVSDGTPFTVNTLVNDPNKTPIRGVEFAYQQPFKFLPEPLNGLGLIQSITWIETADVQWTNFDGTQEPVRILPKWTSFTTLYYERGPLDIRVSYSFRGEFFDQGRPAQNNGIGTQIWNARRGFFDAAIGYKVKPWLELRAEAQNLTNTTNYFFQRATDGRFGNEQSRIDNYYKPGRTFTFTVRGTF